MLYTLALLLLLICRVVQATANSTTTNESASLRCHPQCDCLSHSTAGVSVNCSDRDFTSVPNDLPKNVSVLLLNNNKFQTLSADVVSLYPLLKKIDLSNNKLHCDCSVAWILSTDSNLKVHGKCSSPRNLQGRNISQISKHEICNKDECKMDPSPCDTNANCTNIKGSYKCFCIAGFSGDGYNCTEIPIPQTSLPTLATNAKSPSTTPSASTNTPSSPPDTTSAPPDTTSAPPDTTSAPPDTTSAPPDTTSAPPDTTSAPPDTTSAPPDTTSVPPDTPSVPPNTTSMSTPSVPNTPSVPHNISSAPPDTTSVPVSTVGPKTNPTEDSEDALNMTDLIGTSNKTGLDVETLKNILGKLQRNLDDAEHNEDMKLVKDVVHVANNLMVEEKSETLAETDEKISGVERLLRIVNKALALQARQLIMTHVNGSDEMSMHFNNINADFLVGYANEIAKQELLFPRSNWAKGDQITFPKTDFSKSGNEKIAVVVVTYRQLQDMLPQRSFVKGLSSFQINSRVLSVSVLTSNGDFPTSVKIKFDKKILKNEGTKSSKCVFWKYGKTGVNSSIGGWLDRGCRVSSEDDEHTTCECDHLTDFAVLAGDAITPSGGPVLFIYIATLFLLAALVIAFVRDIIKWRQTRQERLFVLTNECLALMCAVIVFLLGLFLDYEKVLCTVFGVLLHWFVLSVFVWMLTEAIQIYFTVRFGSSHDNRRNKYFLLLAWVLPLIFVGVILAVTKLGIHGSSQWCWYSKSTVLHLTYACPIALCILVGLCVILRVVCLKTAMTDENDKKDIGVVLWLCTFLHLLVAVTWVAGALSAHQPEKEIFQYLFAIFCILLGIYILVYHFLLDREITKSSMKTDSRARPKRDYYSTKQTVMYSEGTPEGKKISVIFPSRKSPPHNKKGKGDKRGTKRNESVNPFDYDPAVTMYPTVNDSSLRSFRSEVSTQQHTLENPPNTLSAITISRPNSNTIELASLTDLDRRPDGAEQEECEVTSEFYAGRNSGALDCPKTSESSETPLATTFGKGKKKSSSDRPDGTDRKKRTSSSSKTSRSSVSGASLGPENDDDPRDETQPFLRRDTILGPEVMSDPPSKIPKRRKRGSRRRLDDDMRDEEGDGVKSKGDEKLLSPTLSGEVEEQQLTCF